MATMKEAIREALTANGGSASREDIRRYVDEHYSGQWQPATLTAHLYGCVVNNPNAYRHHPNAEKFLYKRLDGTFEFYDEKIHGNTEQWEPTLEQIEDHEADTQQLLEASVSLERDVEASLIRNLASLEDGLQFVDHQTVIGVGRIDILAKDRAGKTVVIELKVGEAGDIGAGGGN